MKKIVLSTALVCMTLFTTAIAGNKSENSNAETKLATKKMITGKVIDPVTNEAIAGATVSINGKKVFTDFEGNFEVENPKNKSCEMTVSMISYSTKTVVLDVEKKQELVIDLKR